MKKLVVHPDYDPATYYNDITILYLTQEVDLATYTPACLPNAHDHTAYDGNMAMAAGNFLIYSPSLTTTLGWGKTDPGSPKLSDILLEVKLKVVDEQTCQAAMPKYNITKGMLCAGGVKDVDTCQVV